MLRRSLPRRPVRRFRSSSPLPPTRSSGLVSSLNRPGGNITGVNFLLNTIAAKLFEVLNETVPKATTIGFLVNPSGPEADSAYEVRLAAQRSASDCSWSKPPVSTRSMWPLQPCPTASRCAPSRQRCVFLQSARADCGACGAPGLPAIYDVREFVQAGGLMSYGTSVDDAAAEPASMSAAFSKVLSRAIYRSSIRTSSSW